MQKGDDNDDYDGGKTKGFCNGNNNNDNDH